MGPSRVQVSRDRQRVPLLEPVEGRRVRLAVQPLLLDDPLHEHQVGARGTGKSAPREPYGESLNEMNSVQKCRKSVLSCGVMGKCLLVLRTCRTCALLCF